MNSRLDKLPPYYFVQLENKKKHIEKEGVKVYDFSIGDPDLSPPAKLIDFLRDELGKEVNNYSSTRGERRLRESFAQWYRTRYGVTLDPEKEMTMCVGTKEGIFHLPLALCDQGDVAIIPEPYYPVYLSATTLAGCNQYFLSMREENKFLLEFDSVPQEVLKKAKFIYVNYPNNPTSAVANESFYKSLIEWAQRNNIIIAQDAAYQDVIYDRKPISIMQFEGAKDIAVEFYSFSKLFNITGWRLGFAIGNEKIVSALHKVKSNADSGQYMGIQNAVARFLPISSSFLAEQQSTYKRRRQTFYSYLKIAGYQYFDSVGTFYVWWKLPKDIKSADFADKMLTSNRILVIPGSAFGPAGEGYVRAALTCPEEDIRRALENLKS
ncbi:MAG: aminotransferase class I/II-fold pyridoxal phosphate-dependent enzyme [Planctomycetes bacterium]|nr:aminotransferase class I/II-fold pyridoxal phosphate-dependent enzyme [Planctomycetota bacterium]